WRPAPVFFQIVRAGCGFTEPGGGRRSRRAAEGHRGSRSGRGSIHGPVREEMIYTCYEMVRDCRADKPEGWSYFVASYVPVIRKLLAHYGAGDTAALERVLLGSRDPESSLFRSLEPAPERW